MILVHRLTKSKPRIHGDGISMDARLHGFRHSAREPPADVVDHVPIDRIFLIVIAERILLGTTKTVHQNQAAITRGDEREHRGIVGPRGDVIHGVGTGLERRFGDGRSRGIDGDHDLTGLGMLPKPFDHGDDAANLLLNPDRRRTGPSRLAADIQYPRPLSHHFHARVHGVCGIKMNAAIRKAVGCDVENSHETPGLKRQRLIGI